MNIVKDILDDKGYALWTIDPDGLVFDALMLMQEKNCGALLVMQGDNLAGIMTERDYSRKVILKGLSSKTLAVREIMSSPVVCIRLDQPVEECIAIMAGRNIRYLPVIDNGRLVGMVSIGDVMKALIKKKDIQIGQLENYITGGR